MEQIYRITVRNASKKPIILYERSGAPLGMLEAGEEIVLETPVASNIYSRWNSVTFNDTGVSLTENPSWARPTGRWVLECINRDGLDLEERLISGKQVLLPRNIPRLVEVEVADPLAHFSRMEVKATTERKKDPYMPGYWVRERIVRDCYEDRSEEELLEIENTLFKIEAELKKTTDVVEHV
jgi:hypothetical protein